MLGSIIGKLGFFKIPELRGVNQPRYTGFLAWFRFSSCILVRVKVEIKLSGLNILIRSLISSCNPLRRQLNLYCLEVPLNLLDRVSNLSLYSSTVVVCLNRVMESMGSS